jgi:hypothetical protein
LETTNRFGYKIDGYPTDEKFINSFVEVTVNLMKSDRPLPDIKENAKKEFDLESILDIWETEVFDG